MIVFVITDRTAGKQGKDEHDESEKGNSRKLKPRVLLNAYKNIKFSDLSEAKGVLREKTKEPEKDENENKHELH